MNTNTLAKHYEFLSPEERLPMILKAHLRGDDVEMERLRNTAPRPQYRIPDYHWPGSALLERTMWVMLSLLELAEMHNQMLLIATEEDLLKNEEQGDRFFALADLVAHLFHVKMGAWEMFCRDINMDGIELLDGLPGLNAVVNLRNLPDVPPEKREQLLARFPDVNPLPTLESFLQKHRVWWAGWKS